ncbi:hypothetical protein MMC11_005821 [Xylographa trunciseda]|nr:hypothetical protein [Xylographa trunciseda]
MKCSGVSFLPLLLSVCVPSTLAQLIFPNLFDRQAPAVRAQQDPIMNQPNIALPPSDGGEDSMSSGDTMISDVIGKERIINIFAGFTRDIETITRRLDDNEQNTTVLAPLNSALQKLPRKPWEDPKDYDALGVSAYEGQSGEDRAQRNLRRFVEAHIVPRSPWNEGDKVETLAGNKIWWEGKEGRRIIKPGDIEVSSVASRVSNGEVWFIKGVVNYA